MKRSLLLVLNFCFFLGLHAGEVKKTFSFSNYTISQNGIYSQVNFDGAVLSGKPGEPALPYKAISLMLPPGEKAVSIEITGSNEKIIPGNLLLYPAQYPQPLSEAKKSFVIDEKAYQKNRTYPSSPAGQLMTQYLNGFAFALSTFTPVMYNPVTRHTSYWSDVTVTIRTEPSAASEETLKNLTGSQTVLNRVKRLAQNPEMMNLYPVQNAPATAYKILIITPSQFAMGFSSLTEYYNSIGSTWQIKSTQDINTEMTGQDLAEKIRNYIIQEYQNNQIEHVLLGGDVEHVPFRGFYCYVISGSGYEANDIPADIYFSALDGNWNSDDDDRWGEPGEEDALPELSVARMPFSTNTHLAAILNKTVSYQQDPVQDEWKQPYLVGEHLYDDPMTFGSAYLELLVDNHNENGYSTFGIPSAQNEITRLYDSLVSPPSNIYSWSTQDVINGINEGKTFIHHTGHSNEVYMMRLFISDITNQNFSQVNGVNHNYTLMYTHGCICGAFDYSDCIAEASLTIDNFLVGGVFNSRYGWFNQGTSDGPSTHLHREFISAMYNDTLPDTHLGSAHTMSKIMTAPFIALPGEFEPGAQRWCIYDCNAFGDPSLKIWTDEPIASGISDKNAKLNVSIYPVPAKDEVTLTCILPESSPVTITILNETGQTVMTLDRGKLPSGKQISTLNVSSLSAGMYFCKITSGTSTVTRKLLVTK